MSVTRWGFMRRCRMPPPMASTQERGGGSRLPALIGIGAVSHVSALEARNNALVFTPHSLLECTTPPRAATTSTREVDDHNARHKRLQPKGLPLPQLKATGARVTGADTPRHRMRINVGKRHSLPCNRPPLNGQGTKGNLNSHHRWPHLNLIGVECAQPYWLSITQPLSF